MTWGKREGGDVGGEEERCGRGEGGGANRGADGSGTGVEEAAKGSGDRKRVHGGEGMGGFDPCGETDRRYVRRDVN